MDLGFNRTDFQHDAAVGHWASNFSSVPAWQDLSVRLHASWAARREFLSAIDTRTPRRSNFDPASAAALAGLNHASHAVNLTASGNRKPDEGKVLPVAGDSESGTRGLG